jgi:hypothetical protein
MCTPRHAFGNAFPAQENFTHAISARFPTNAETPHNLIQTSSVDIFITRTGGPIQVKVLQFVNCTVAEGDPRLVHPRATARLRPSSTASGR